LLSKGEAGGANEILPTSRPKRKSLEEKPKKFCQKKHSSRNLERRNTGRWLNRCLGKSRKKIARRGQRGEEKTEKLGCRADSFNEDREARKKSEEPSISKDEGFILGGNKHAAISPEERKT